MYNYWPSDMQTPAELALDASPAGQEFRRRCERRGWRTWRFVRAVRDRTGDSPRGLVFSANPLEGDWWLLCADSGGTGGEKVPADILAAAGVPA